MIKQILFKIITPFISILITIIFLEFTLRSIPIQGFVMGAGIYDPELGLYKFKPNSKFIRTNIRNEKIIGIASKLETTVQILSEMKKLPEVTFPIKCHPKNQEIIIARAACLMQTK